MKNPWVVVGVLAIVLFGGAILIGGGLDQSTADTSDIAVSPNIKGNPDAEVELVEYSDFQCPACAQFYPVVKEITEQYGDQVRFEYRHFPLISAHPFAQPAAQAAEAAGQQDKFFEYHDLLFENQQQWSASRNPNQYFEEYAEQLDLNMEQFNAQRNSRALRNAVQEDLRSGIEAEVTGTPTFYLNGEKVENLQTLGELIERVEAAIGVSATTTASDEAAGTSDVSETSADTAPATPDVRFGF